MSDASSKPAIAAKPLRNNDIPWHALSAVLVVVVGFLVAEIAGALLVGLYPNLRHWSAAQAQNWLDNAITAQFFFVLISEFVFVGTVCAFIRWRKGSLRVLGVSRPRGKDAAYAVLGLLAYLCLYIVSVAVVSAFVHVNVDQKQDLGFNNPTGPIALALTFVSLVLLPPLAEEFAFRGFLFSTFRQRMGLVASTLLTSALFAVPHLMEADSGVLWIAGIDTFVLSIVLCYAREKTGRLWAGIVIHMLKNGVAFLTVFVGHH